MDEVTTTSKVEVYYWENQRFKPFQGGWQKPYSNDYAYSNDDGTIHIPHERDEPPIACLPLGWQWISSWEVDLTGSYGQVDKEGWGYAVSFENLIDNTKNKCLSGEVGRLSIVRRRRWIRYRECVTAESKKEFAERMQWIQLFSQRVSKISL